MRIVGTIARTGLGCALTSLGVLGILSFQAGVAQAAASPQTTDAAVELEEIVVTARRREESLQDTPVAVTVITSEMLDSMQIAGTTDLDKIVPNLQFHSYGTLTGNNSAAQVFIRGIGQTDATPAVDPGVGLYIDDVYMGRSVGGAMEMRDIAMTQVLRGPQGTLFGRNTIGGAVLLTTNGPGEGAGHTLRASVGEDKLFDIFGAYDLLDGEQWSARISGGLRKRDGYVDRPFDDTDLGDENSRNGQIALRYRPRDDVSLTLRFDAAREDENGSPFVFHSMNEAALFVGVGSINAGCPDIQDGLPPPTLVGPTADPRCGNDAQYLGEFTNGGTAPAFSELRNRGASLVGIWDANDTWSFKSITADRRLRWAGARDADNTPLLVLHTNSRSRSDQFSQELQALYSGERLDGVVGLYYFDEDTFDRVLVDLSNPGTSYDTQRVTLGSKAKAAFTEWTWSFTDRLSATAGLRYTDETKSLQGTMFNVSPATAPEPATPPTALCPFAGAPNTQTGCLFLGTTPYKIDFSDTTLSGSAQYRWTDNAMTYVSYSEGFKSGGFNQHYNAAPPGNAPISFGAETATTWELGTKLTPMRGLRVNMALFTTTYDDIQMTYRLGVVPLLFNAGKASIDGGELEVAWLPTSRLQVDASVGYLDSGFDSVTDPPPFGSVTPSATATINSRLPFTPEWTTHVGLGYTFTLGNGWQVIPRVDSSYTGAQFFDAGNSAEISQTGGVTIYSGSVSVQSPDSQWRVALNAQNMGDKLYPVAGTSSLGTASGYAEIINARPRMLSLSATYNF
ncbi:MAG TPA: TonB-dependent receptor [Steroidobacteraceae bacterium]|nr:TonB-dependent receptor [Steroidobacteraceae bacterium]